MIYITPICRKIEMIYIGNGMQGRKNKLNNKIKIGKLDINAAPKFFQ